MVFKKESDFESNLIKVLITKGWEEKIIEYPTEEDLIKNWANILFNNNMGIDRLNNVPLTDTEMSQILEQINTLATPNKLNNFINGKSVTIKRDNEEDKLHLGKEISLKIYDRKEIAAGQSRYQIVKQPYFGKKNDILPDRRGDIMLLINGMPVIHIELKRSGVHVSEAYNQVEKYSKEKIFTGLFSLIQVFVAMTPDATKYFANPGTNGVFNKNYYFTWADFNNEPMNNWKDIASSLLSIPMAHQLIGFYTIADESDGVLKVMRSYQYYAANAISDKVSKTKLENNNQRGGYIWHTTGSGKTMTSFKSAQLIADSQDADKVVFLMDRIELGTQSLNEYRGFAGESKGISNQDSSVKSTENTYELITKLKSNSHLDTLIVTSIQKMSNIKDEGENIKSIDIEEINKKRIVFIVDEAHRSTFGDMLITIKETFPNAIFFGFTGTPIHDENQKKKNTTATVFGNELHRYSIADGIRDKNVLGFDHYLVTTFNDDELRKNVALHQAKAKTEQEVFGNPDKEKIYYEFMDSSKHKMYTDLNDNKKNKGIEDYVPNSQYNSDIHRETVVKDINNKWTYLSHNSKFHAILATSSIDEAIKYYRLLKEKMPFLKTTCLFDPNIDNSNGFENKEDALIEIIDDYNNRFNKKFTISTFPNFKKDVASRLAHKDNYKRIDNDINEQLNLLIVVDQMLTGYDSKWINTLYLDKMLEYENIIQAFSRTNRLFGPEKPFGTIRYYRRPHTMQYNIEEAVKLYSGNKPFGLFVDKLNKNIEKMNQKYHDVKDLFLNESIEDFSKLPNDRTAIAKFVSLFNEFNEFYEAAKIQGFKLDTTSYKYTDENDQEREIHLDFDSNMYDILLQRYKDVQDSKPENDEYDDTVVIPPYEIEGNITEIYAERINAEYINSKFEKYLKELKNTDPSNTKLIDDILDKLHKLFAHLSQEDQKYANIFFHDIQSGDVEIDDSKSFMDYIVDYKFNAQSNKIHNFAETFGLDENMLISMMELKLTKKNINEYGRLDNLINTADKSKYTKYFNKNETEKLSNFALNSRFRKIVNEFIIDGGFDLD